MVYKPEPLPFATDSLNGISQNTIETHYEKLYKGYVNKYNEIEEKLLKVDVASANQTYSEWRGLKSGETFALDAILLHELYFGNLGGAGDISESRIGDFVEKQFGSFDNFKNIVTATGLAARGWAVTAWDPVGCKINVFACDTHDQGGIWGAVPLLILDVYEHAYYMDYGSDRKSYIDAFWKNVDWETVDNRFSTVR